MDLLERRRMMMASANGSLPSGYSLLPYITSTGNQFMMVDCGSRKITNTSVYMRVYNGASGTNYLLGVEAFTASSGSVSYDYGPYYARLAYPSGSSLLSRQATLAKSGTESITITTTSQPHAFIQGDYEIFFGFRKFGGLTITENGGWTVSYPLTGAVGSSSMNDMFYGEVYPYQGMIIGGVGKYSLDSIYGLVSLSAYCLVGKIYECIIYNGDNEYGHLLPARRNQDNVCGMYDVLLGKFYTSATATAYTGV